MYQHATPDVANSSSINLESNCIIRDPWSKPDKSCQRPWKAGQYLAAKPTIHHGCVDADRCCLGPPCQPWWRLIVSETRNFIASQALFHLNPSGFIESILAACTFRWSEMRVGLEDMCTVRRYCNTTSYRDVLRTIGIIRTADRRCRRDDCMDHGSNRGYMVGANIYTYYTEPIGRKYCITVLYVLWQRLLSQAT